MTRRLNGDLVVTRAFRVPDFLTDEAVRWELATGRLMIAAAAKVNAKVGQGPFPREEALLRRLAVLVSSGTFDRLHPDLAAPTSENSLVDDLIPFDHPEVEKMKLVGGVAVNWVWDYLTKLDRELKEVSLFTDDPVPEPAPE